ncbi:MAG: ABC transporter ATP-binding protein [Thermoleophilia bacterium]|nr:ABC transporter ATP-binding protein [Thermoleophilia bacterium]
MSSPVIAATGVSVRFGSVQALDGVDVTVDAPATGLLGANGAGKSTLMKAVLGLLRPQSGTLRVFGEEVGTGAHELRRRIGYMPEHECLPLEMAGSDLVVHLAQLRGLPRRVAIRRASEALFVVGLEEERSRLIGTYSTGMRQRAKLAQAIVHSPELVILDEPTNGLDPAGRAEMLELVRRLSRELGIAVLMSSHVLDDIQRTCDAVVVLREGRVAASERIARLADGGDAMEVRIVGDADAFAAALATRGHAATRDGDAFTLHVDADTVLDGIRDAAAEAGAGISRLGAAGRTLEDAVIEAME